MSGQRVSTKFVSSCVTIALASVGIVWYVRRELKKEKQPSGEKEVTGSKQQEEQKRKQNKENTSTAKTTQGETIPPPISEIKTVPEGKNQHDGEDERRAGRVLSEGTITIAHGSVTGTCEKLAKEVYDVLVETLKDDDKRNVQIGKVEEWDWWDELLNSDDDPEEEKKRRKSDARKNVPPIVLLLLPTHHGGSWPSSSTCLEQALQDLRNDWRIENKPLKKNKIHVGVMGMGCSDYSDDTMGRPAKQAFQLFRQLGATMIGKKVRVGDDAITDSPTRVIQAWIHHDILPTVVSDDDDAKNNDYMHDKEPQVMDLEDMGNSFKDMSEQASENNNNQNDNDDEEKTSKDLEPREMVTTTQAKALQKEGYKLIGTHSAVKLCRWTKHQLRGRGGCYKHTFYGITSYQCMEATPSLACANKCVFCWRHHKNPVGKEWKWKTDDPHFIVEEAVSKHVQMIKETKGIPGVRMDRWKEAHTVRHCALSLVGEPIMYPRIDELLGDLHSRKISSFLVTNGQHPQAISSLRPVTQLYVSVDAPTPESLVAIDRPLFADAWERLQQSLILLKDKGQRTVARLTVVKGWNSDEVEGYAKLIALGQVSLIEIKGVTFCGKSDASNLNMSNTPWHHEVVELAKTLKHELQKLRELGGPDAPPEYGLACEHKHSVSVLLARVDQFTEESSTTSNSRMKWRTWIDYDKFHELASKSAEDPSFSFSVKDYTAETPAWALFGSEEEGFDPTDTRHRKKKKHPKYTKFDSKGVPTHDHNNEPLSSEERSVLSAMMVERMKELGGCAGSTTTELKGGEKVIEDASLMFRGLVIAQP